MFGWAAHTVLDFGSRAEGASRLGDPSTGWQRRRVFDDQARDVARVARRIRERDRAAHRMADQRERSEVQVVRERVNVSCELLVGVARIGVPLGLTVAAQVGRDHVELGRQGVANARPGIRGTRKAMHQHDRVGARGGPLQVPETKVVDRVDAVCHRRKRSAHVEARRTTAAGEPLTNWSYANWFHVTPARWFQRISKASSRVMDRPADRCCSVPQRLNSCLAIRAVFNRARHRSIVVPETRTGERRRR